LHFLCTEKWGETASQERGTRDTMWIDRKAFCVTTVARKRLEKEVPSTTRCASTQVDSIPLLLEPIHRSTSTIGDTISPMLPTKNARILFHTNAEEFHLQAVANSSEGRTITNAD